MQNNIVLFDGVCNLCSGAVQWIIRHDKKGNFVFASLQSETGKKLLLEFGVPDTMDSVIFIENSILYVKSSAALRIAKKSDGAYKLLYAFILVPAFIRDWVYDAIARNRYRWFGKKEVCWIPTDALKARFI